jgi:hypothetical protein
LQPILVLADVSMPGKDGYEVCDYVKTSADFHHVPVLLVASDVEPYDERLGAQVRADGIIKKPFTPHDLIAMVAKFAALGEAAASRSTFSDTLVTSSPVAAAEVLPMDAELEGARRSPQQDLAALSAGVAFAGPPLDGIRAAPPEPLLDFPLQPSPEPALQISAQSSPEPRLEASAENVLGGPSEPILEIPTEPPPELALEPTPEPILEPMLEATPEPTPATAELISGTALEAALELSAVTPEPTPEPILEATPEPTPATAELISGTALEAAPEPTAVTPEPTPEPILEATPEPTPATAELISGTALGAAPEQASVVSEPALESGLPLALEFATETVHRPAEATLEAPPAVPVEEPPLATDPPLVEERVELLPAPGLSPELVKPPADRTMVFHVPAENAEPVLSDKLAAASSVPEPHPLVEEQYPKPIAVDNLDSSYLTEAAEVQFYIAPPETEAASAPEPAVVKPGEAPGATPTVIDPRLVYVIVHKVVVKMSPPVLSLEVVEELIRRLTAEITAELNAESS